MSVRSLFRLHVATYAAMVLVALGLFLQIVWSMNEVSVGWPFRCGLFVDIAQGWGFRRIDTPWLP
jgi:hypothetical protein